MLELVAGVIFLPCAPIAYDVDLLFHIFPDPRAQLAALFAAITNCPDGGVEGHVGRLPSLVERLDKELADVNGTAGFAKRHYYERLFTKTSLIFYNY
jgi:hypothetical protein